MWYIDAIACGTGMLGVITTAMSEKWYGWAIGTFASICWTIHGIHTNQWALAFSGAFFVISQSIGIYRRFRADKNNNNSHDTNSGLYAHRPVPYKFKEIQKMIDKEKPLT